MLSLKVFLDILLFYHKGSKMMILYLHLKTFMMDYSEVVACLCSVSARDLLFIKLLCIIILVVKNTIILFQEIALMN